MKPPAWVGVALVLASFTSPEALGAPEAITEDDAIRLFLSESPQTRLVLLRAEAVRAELSIGTELADPTVAYQFEEAAGVRDEFLTLQQGLPITGRLSLLRERADAAYSAAELLGEREFQNTTSSLRIAFYGVLYRDSVIEILGRGDKALDRTVEMLRERERQGEGSGYDVLRAEQEMAELRLELDRAEAASTTARARFGSFFEESLSMGSAAISGDFSLTESPWGVEEAVVIALEPR